jgi:hypothetical protein
VVDFPVIHPGTELRFISSAIGYGVFATERIPRGTITWVRCAFDRTITVAEAQALDPYYAAILDRYAYVDRAGDFVLCWDHGRYMNHSCAPTCLSPGFDLDLAVRDIEKGEELTCDYAMLNQDELFECRCGKPECRHIVRATDRDLLADEWDVRLRTAFESLAGSPQPLWPIVKEKDRVTASAEGRAPVPSCRVHFFATFHARASAAGKM